MEINLYDFDGTIYDGDSTRDFFFFEVKRHPLILITIPYTLLSAILYLLHIINKTKMKENFYMFLKYIKDIDKEITLFWDIHYRNIKKFYVTKQHTNDIIISASPEFLLMPLKNKLKVKDIIASRINKYNGKTTGLNCHDYEKVKRLNEKYQKYHVINAYTDSYKSDYPILELADNKYIVNKNKIVKANFKN